MNTSNNLHFMSMLSKAIIFYVNSFISIIEHRTTRVQHPCRTSYLNLFKAGKLIFQMFQTINKYNLDRLLIAACMHPMFYTRTMYAYIVRLAKTISIFPICQHYKLGSPVLVLHRMSNPTRFCANL